MEADVEKELLQVKKQLKLWENSFASENKRKPNKDDIAAASQTIQDAYKRYAVLKHELQKSKKTKINSDVWGVELNKSSTCNDEIKSSVAEKAKSSQSSRSTSLMKKLGQKLLEKSVNSPLLNLKPQRHLSGSFSEPRRSTFLGNSHSQSFHEEEPFGTDNSSGSGILSQRENMNIAANNGNPMNSSFLSVLDGVSVKHKQVTVPKHDPVDVIPFGFGSAKKDLSQKYKYVNNFTSSVEPSLDDGSKADNHFCDSVPDHECVTKENPFEDFPASEDFDPCSEFSDVNEKCNQEPVPSQTLAKKTWSEINKPISSRQLEAVDENSCPSVEKKQNQVSAARNVETRLKRGRKRQIDDDVEVDAKPKSKRSKTTEQQAKKEHMSKSHATRSPEEQEDAEWVNSGVSEVGWQTDEVKLDLGEMSPQEKKVDKPKTSRSRAGSKSVPSENYVRLNMKVKTYRRKGQQMTGGKYKRMQWKQKMKARSESFGQDKCFKCGGTGHWASKCQNKGKRSVPQMECIDLDTAVDDAAYPTLKEAFQMSRGIRKGAKTAAKSKPTEERVDQTKEIDSIKQDVEEDSDIELEIYRENHFTPVAPPTTEPLYRLQDDGTPPEPDQDVLQALQMFGFKTFRPGQKEAIMRVLCGESTLVVMSTGSGKSLCYQLPAYLYATKIKAITIVISPLVSLMEDQVTGLPAGVKGLCLHTNMTKVQRRKVMEQVAEGSVHFLLVSPEAMTSSTSARSLLGSSQLPPIAFVCIDEVHCVSEWSHHFRPSYLRICKVLKETYGVKCMLGLTATATMVTAASVSQHLGIKDYKTSTIRDLPVPTNLLLSTSRDVNKDEALLALLKGDRFSACDSIIIYCTRREQTDRVATLIRTCLQGVKSDMPAETSPVKGKAAKGKKVKAASHIWSAECYHAGMTPAARRRVQRAFMSGKLRVVVATVAFGMGVDKSDVRGIIHYSIPKSFESYVQEIGRAGRDGKPSHCHVFLDHEGRDTNELKRHIYSNTIDRFIIKKLAKKLFVPCKCRQKQNDGREKEVEKVDIAAADGDDDDDAHSSSSKRICPGHERAIPIEKTVQELDIREEGIATLLCYLELHPKAWLINLQHVYATCTVQCYGGPQQLQAVAKKCPPLGVAVAMQQKHGVSFSKSNSIEFPVIEVSDVMGWDSGPVKRELSLLQWDMQSADGFPKKTGVLVTFTDLAFHVRSYGDLTDDELEEVVSFLTERIQTQERTELGQLDRLQKTLHSVSHKDVWMCADHVDCGRSDKLKAALRQYFDEQPEIKDGQVTLLSFAREYGSQDQVSVLEAIKCENLDSIRADVRQFINTYSAEHTLSGRIIARVFHGIGSPCFPAKVWGRVRRFWRCHLDVDFNVLRRIATQELIHFR